MLSRYVLAKQLGVPTRGGQEAAEPWMMVDALGRSETAALQKLVGPLGDWDVGVRRTAVAPAPATRYGVDSTSAAPFWIWCRSNNQSCKHYAVRNTLCSSQLVTRIL